MQDQPEPTREEQEQAPEQMDEHEAMQFPGHDRPADAAQDDEEIHDA
jgi:hypothetical protein